MSYLCFLYSSKNFTIYLVVSSETYRLLRSALFYFQALVEFERFISVNDIKFNFIVIKEHTLHPMSSFKIIKNY